MLKKSLIKCGNSSISKKLNKEIWFPAVYFKGMKKLKFTNGNDLFKIFSVSKEQMFRNKAI